MKLAKFRTKHGIALHAGGAPAQSGCFQHQQLRLSYVCTSATAAFAFDAFDAYGVSGFTRLCRSASSPSQHSFCTLLRRKYLGRRFYFLYDMLFIHLYIKSRWIRVISEIFLRNVILVKFLYKFFRHFPKMNVNFTIS